MADPLEREALNDLLAMTGGDAALFVELLDTFLTDADQYLGELHAAVAADDPAALQRPAHSLKSNAMSVGATRLAELSRSLETDARTGSVPAARDRVAEVRDELALVRDAVASVRREAVDGG